MKYTKLLLIGVLVLLTGCSYNYELTINKDLSVDEKVLASSGINEFNPLEIDEMMINLSDNYKGYTFDKHIKEDLTITGVRHYQNLNGYKRSTIFDEYFKDVTITRKSSKIKLVFNPKTDDNLFYGPEVDNSMIDIKASIKLPFKVLNTNADHIDKSTNTYSWIITNDNQYRSLILKFNQNIIFNEPWYQTLGRWAVDYGLYILIGVVIIVASTLIIKHNRLNNTL